MAKNTPCGVSDKFGPKQHRFNGPNKTPVATRRDEDPLLKPEKFTSSPEGKGVIESGSGGLSRFEQGTAKS